MKLRHALLPLTLLIAGEAHADALKVDCSAKANEKVDACARPVWISSKAIGTGPRVKDIPGFGARFLGGLVEPGTLFVGVANGETGAIVSVDLATGNRKLISGKMEDPANGPIKVGTGPEFTHVYDIARGTDGNLYTYGHNNVAHPTVIHKVDPKTGNRMLVWESENKAFATCVTNASHAHARPVATSFQLAAGGGFYAALNNSPIGVGYGIVKISQDGKTCEPVSTWKVAAKPAFQKGSGPEDPDTFQGLKMINGALYAIAGMNGGIWKFDVATGQRTRVSSPRPEIGTGPQTGRGWSTYDPQKKLLWTGGSWGSSDTNLVSVDLANGNRTLLNVKAGAARVGKQSWGGVWMHPTLPLLIVGIDDYALTLVDPATGNSNLLSQ